MPDLLSHFISEFRGTPPDVPFAPGLELKTFTTEEDPNPFFVRLPLVEIGKKSINGVEWSVSASRRLVEQINTKRPEGILGHIPKEQRHFKYELPSLRWVGATIVENKVWGKAYVPANKPDVRDYLKQSMRLNARVGTSVYGMSSGRGVEDFNLESIDLGHPDRVANPTSVAVPIVTAENQQGEIDVEGEKLVNFLTSDRDRVISELSDLQKTSNTLQTQFEALKNSKDEASRVVSEIRTLGDFADDADLVAEVRKMTGEINTLRAEKQAADTQTWIAEFVKIEALRPTIAANIGTPADKDEAKTLITELMKRSDIEAINKALVAAQAGPSVMVSESNGGFKLDDSEEGRAASVARTGIGV